MSEEFVIVETEYGSVKGDKRSTESGDVYCNFQGIPYMKAPLGNLRFKAPVKPENWSEVYDATKDCPSYVITEFKTNRIKGQEDAGFINVFTKNTTPEKPFPVMAYVRNDLNFSMELFVS
jgi:carboxylesterase type B